MIALALSSALAVCLVALARAHAEVRRLTRLLDDRTPTEIVELRPDLWQYERAVRRDRARLAGGAS